MAKLALVTKLRTATATKLQTKVTEYLSIAAQCKALEAQKSELSAELLAMTDDAGGAIETEQHKVNPVDGCSAERVSKEVLIKLGVKASIIRKATVPGSKYRYVRITDKAAEAAKAASKKGA